MTKTLLRNSERGAFKTCRFRWHLAYNGLGVSAADRPLRSREPAKALWFGDLVHQALAAYYKPGTKRGPAPAKTFVKLYDADDRISAVLRNDEGEWESMRDLGAGMLKAYVAEFQARDQEWEVLASEKTFRIPINVPALEWHINDTVSAVFPSFKVTVVGTVDGLWRHRLDADRLAFKEFKTAGSIRLTGLAMDDQAGYYWTYAPRWMWRQEILPEGTYPTEILYTFLRKAIRSADVAWDAEGRKLNKDGSISKSQPPPFFERLPIYRDQADRINMHERVVEEAREMWMARNGLLTPIKNPGPLHQPNCAGCPFKDPCELHEAGSDWLTLLGATTEPWQPYAAHELIERR